MFPAFRGEMAGVFLRLRSVEAIVLGETTDAEKETESSEFLKSGSGESLTLRRRKGKVHTNISPREIVRQLFGVPIKSGKARSYLPATPWRAGRGAWLVHASWSFQARLSWSRTG